MKKILNAGNLKIIALCTMAIDHIGAALTAAVVYYLPAAALPDGINEFSFVFMRIIGRIAFPLYAILVAEGCAHTRNLKKYMLRLFAFAVISQLPFQLFINLIDGRENIFAYGRLNVMFTLSISAVVVFLFKSLLEKKKTAPVYVLGIVACYVFIYIIKSDYGVLGISAVLFSYMLRVKRLGDVDTHIHGSHISQGLAAGAVVALNYTSNVYYAASALFGGLLMAFYNGKGGSRRGKWFFYIFYPLHLAILASILLILKYRAYL